MKKSKNVVWLAVAILIVLAATVLKVSTTPKIEKDIKAQYLKGGDFTLSNEGKPFQLSNLNGSPVVLYFGFTHCPDVCPLGLTVIRDAFKALPESEVKGVFVTLDPERDTRIKMEEYVAFFHPDIIGLSGTLEEIKQVAGKYGTYFKKGEPDENGSYSVDHTAYFYLLDREGELLRVLDHNAKAEEIAELLAKL